MRLRYWLIFSFIFHFTLGFLFVKNQSASNTEVPLEYVDLTVLPPGPLSETVAIPPRVKIQAASTAVKAFVPSADSKANDVTENSNTETPSTSGGGGGPDASTAVSFSEVTRLPKVKKEVKALYPEEGKKAGVDGPVVLEVLIDKSGKVQHVKVLRGQGHGLDEAAITALQSFEFQPAFKGNEPVAVKIQYTYRFKLGIN